MSFVGRFLKTFILIALISGCAIETTSAPSSLSREDWIKHWAETSDSVTAYVELKPAELGVSLEAQQLAIDSALERMKTSQVVWETLTGSEEVLLSDGKTVSAESVIDYNSKFKLFVESQENLQSAVKDCQNGNDFEVLTCMTDGLVPDYQSKGNAAYQALYQSWQKFKQDAID